MTDTPRNQRDLAERFGKPLPADALGVADADPGWYWDGLIPHGAIVLLTAHPKAGKTTLLCDLLRAASATQSFCARSVRLASAVVVSEEGPGLWAQRHQQTSLGPSHRFLCRPFLGKPTTQAWADLLGYLRHDADETGVDIIVFDTISTLWPVQNENDAAQVQSALLPLFGLLEGGTRSLILGHHLKKTDGQEGTGARGSSALTGFVDVMLELRRTYPDDPRNPRRRLSAYGRWERTNGTLDLRLDDTTGRYTLADTTDRDPDELAAIATVLQEAGQALTTEETYAALPEGQRGRRTLFLQRLRAGVALGRWQRTGNGRAGSPFRYSHTSVLIPPPPSSVAGMECTDQHGDYKSQLMSHIYGPRSHLEERL